MAANTVNKNTLNDTLKEIEFKTGFILYMGKANAIRSDDFSLVFMDDVLL